MNNRLRLALAVLVILCLANLGWRLWANRGLVTVHADGTSVAEVVRSLEKQGGIRLRSNLPAEATVTMHVTKVPLLHALEVLSANTGASWSVGYFTAPDKATIETALATFTGGERPEGWKRFSMPGMRGMGGVGGYDVGITDPRTEQWNATSASEGTLHAYLEQASLALSAQLWAPEQWNPAISKTPSAGEARNAIPKLAKAAQGASAEVFLLTGRRDDRPPTAAAGGGERREPGAGERPAGGGFRGGPPSPEARKAMEERTLASIEKLPKEQRAEARAEFDERRRFFEELSKLPEEERRAKMQERMEQMMNNSAAAQRFENGMAKRGAMQSASQRAERYRGYLQRKQSLTQ
ncbi:MAG TPA: hypothetical protein VF614_11250 [Chthoniobacteraceae bacterium]|jgi:hypothetical protein